MYKRQGTCKDLVMSPIFVLFHCARSLHLTNPKEFFLHCMNAHTYRTVLLCVYAVNILATIGLFVTPHTSEHAYLSKLSCHLSHV